MGVIFLGEHSCAHIGTLRFWAERGLVHCEDSRDNSYESVSVRTFLERARGLSDMIGRSTVKRDTGADASLRENVQRFLDEAVEVARKAQEQGMPTDRTAVNDLKARRPKTLVMSSGNAIM